MIRLFTKEVVDGFIKENFQRLNDYFQKDPWRKGSWRFVTKTLTAGTYPATLTFPHGFPFIPKDVLPLSVSPQTATATWNTDDFDRTNLSVTISAALTVRAYVGRYEETTT